MAGDVVPADIDPMLQEYYADGFKDMVYDVSGSVFASLEKKEDCSGRRYDQPTRYGRNNGRSRKFDKAQSNRSANKNAVFLVPWCEDFGVVSISRSAIKQASGKASFIKETTDETDAVLKNIGRNAGISIFRGSGGMRGQISAGYSSGTTVTLNDIEEITNFEKGDWINFSSADGNTASDTLTQSAGLDLRRQIVSIDRDAGTITFDASTGLAASLYMFVEGDFQASCNGLIEWCPTTAPGATAFLGVDRTPDSRLYGTRVSALNVSINEAVKRGLARMGREGAHPDTVVMNHAKAMQWELELDNKVVWTDTNVGASSVTVQTAKFVSSDGRKATVMVDKNCQDDLIWIFEKGALKVVSIGPVPDVVDDDGVTILREAASNGFEFRADATYNLTVEDTHAVCVLTVESD